MNKEMTAAGYAGGMGEADEPLGLRGLLDFLRMLARYLRPHRGQVWVLGVGLLIELSSETAVRLSFQVLIDRAIVPHDAGMLASVLGGLAALALAGAALSFWCDLMWARVGVALLNAMRRDMAEHLQRLPLAYFVRQPAGDVLSRFSGDLASVSDGFTGGVPVGTTALVGGLITVGLLFTLEWRLALVATAGLIASIAAAHGLAARTATAGYAEKQAEARVMTAVAEQYGAQPVVRAFGLEAIARRDLATLLERLRHAGVRANFAMYLAERAPAVGVALTHVLLIGLGGWWTMRGELTIGTLVSFQVLFQGLAGYVHSLGWVGAYLARAAGGGRRVAELLAAPAEPPPRPGATDLPRMTRALALDEVTFAYADGPPVLERVSFAVPQGARVAIVGPSGAGKSTLVHLLLRFADPAGGSITLDGRDLRDGTTASLRGQIAVVFQESFLFDTSVRENIRLGRPEATDAEVEQAARAAEIHEAIAAFPRGYDTPAGERGARFSGGQRQRLALARALLRDPAILLLDEATSALDPASEAAIDATLRRVARGRTVITITHRLTSVADADRLYVLDRGRLVEQGRHDELLAGRGVYARLWEKQLALVATMRTAPPPPLPGGSPWALPAEALRRLAHEGTLAELPAWHTLVTAGEPVELLAVLLDGRAGVFLPEASGREIWVESLGAGDHVGAEVLRGNPTAAYTVKTLTPCRVLLLEPARLQAVLAADAALRELWEGSGPA